MDDTPRAALDRDGSVEVDDAALHTAGRRRALPWPDWLALFAALMFCAGFFTRSLVPGWSVRFAGLLLVLPIGGLYLARLLRLRDGAAVALSCVVGWTALVIALQPAPLVRMFGMVGTEASLVVYAGVAACWALGRQLSGSGRRVLPWVVLGGLAVCGVVGVAQVVAQVDTGVMALERGRAHGLATYAVYYGSLMSCGAVLLSAVDVPRRWRGAQAIGVLAFAVMSGLSGSRAALAAALFGVLYLLVRRRDLVRALAVISLVSGTVIASWMSGSLGERAEVADVVRGDPAEVSGTPDIPGSTPPAATGGSTVSRLTGGDGFVGGGISWRIDGWTAGLEAWIERPITGWGAGNFRQAVQEAAGPGFEQDSPRFDAHNLLVELLTAIGAPGALLAAAFTACCLRRSRGPLALAAATLAWSWLLQPAGLSTLPLAMLILGAAYVPLTQRGSVGAPTEPDDALAPHKAPDPFAAMSDRAARTMGAIGVVLAVAFSTADVRLANAVRAGDADAVESTAAFFPTDPAVADLVAQGWTLRAEETTGTERDEAIAAALDWSQRAVSRQDDSPRWLDHRAFRQARFGDFEQAVLTLADALALQPQRPESRDLLARIAAAADDDEIDALVEQTLCVADGRACGAG